MDSGPSLDGACTQFARAKVILESDSGTPNLGQVEGGFYGRRW